MLRYDTINFLRGLDRRSLEARIDQRDRSAGDLCHKVHKRGDGAGEQGLEWIQRRKPSWELRADNEKSGDNWEFEMHERGFW